jgi:hypothetical protein
MTRRAIAARPCLGVVTQALQVFAEACAGRLLRGGRRCEGMLVWGRYEASKHGDVSAGMGPGDGVRRQLVRNAAALWTCTRVGVCAADHSRRGRAW